MKTLFVLDAVPPEHDTSLVNPVLLGKLTVLLPAQVHETAEVGPLAFSLVFCNDVLLGSDRLGQPSALALQLVPFLVKSCLSLGNLHRLRDGNGSVDVGEPLKIAMKLVLDLMFVRVFGVRTGTAEIN